MIKKRKQKFNKLALMGLICTIITIIIPLYFIESARYDVIDVLPLLLSIVLIFVVAPIVFVASIVLCISALTQISKNQQKGKWLAIATLIIDEVILLIVVLFFIKMWQWYS